MDSSKPANWQPIDIHYGHNSNQRAADYKHTNYYKPNNKPNSDYWKNIYKDDDREKQANYNSFREWRLV